MPHRKTIFWLTWQLRCCLNLSPFFSHSWFNFSLSILVKEVATNERIVFEWPRPHGVTSTITLTFTSVQEGQATGVRVEQTGLRGANGTGDAAAAGQALIDDVIDQTKGWTFVLCGAKAWLEHGVHLGVPPDNVF
jgi:uncharacterized protein YndB with AHSA1/START domain